MTAVEDRVLDSGQPEEPRLADRRRGLPPRRRTRRQRLLVAAAAAAAALALLSTLSYHWASLTRIDAPLSFVPDRRLRMVHPEAEARVRLPLTVRWEVEDFPLTGGNQFGVFIDEGIPNPDGQVRLRICSRQGQAPPNPGEMRGVCVDQRDRIIFTKETAITIECLEPQYHLGARRAHQHRVSVVLLDGERRRVGEAAASVSFRANEDDVRACRGFQR